MGAEGLVAGSLADVPETSAQEGGVKRDKGERAAGMGEIRVRPGNTCTRYAETANWGTSRTNEITNQLNKQPTINRLLTHRLLMNHCLPRSMRLMRAIGTLNILCARPVMRSMDGSRSSSRILYDLSTLSRSISCSRF